MVRLQANGEYAALAESITTTGYVANLGGREHEVFITHQLGYGGGHFRRDSPLKRLQVRSGGLVVEDEFAKLADSHMADTREGRGIVGIENQARNFVGFGGDERIVQQIHEGKIRQGTLCGNAFALGSGGNSSKLIARFFFIRLREDF